MNNNGVTLKCNYDRRMKVKRHYKIITLFKTEKNLMGRCVLPNRNRK